MTTISSPNQAEINKILDGLMYDFKVKCIRPALYAAGDAMVAGYRSVLEKADVPERPPQGQNFQRAFTAVGRKVAERKDETGFYAVVGIKKNGSQRAAPQVLWGEKGTKRRETKAGANRGIEPIQFWLATAVAQSTNNALNAMMQKLKTSAAKYRK